MFEGKTVAVVVPCHNEETQIGDVLATMPEYVDHIIVVDDASTDRTVECVRERLGSATDDRTILIVLEKNQGVGAAIAAGYKEAVRRRIDISAVMAGDGQMDPKQLRMLLAPVARGDADYTKANRLYYRKAWEMIPRKRYLGNAFLSMLTKIASGYWRLADSQTGYTAINLAALEAIDLDKLYPRYGYPNDMLVRLNVYDLRVLDVPLRPVYNVGEVSKMRLWKVIPTMSMLIFRRFCWRMWQKYVVRDFHPLVFFYLGSMAMGAVGVGLFVRMIWLWIADNRIPPMNALAWVFCTISAVQFGLFAMWFDMEQNRDLSGTLRPPPPGAPRAPDEPAPGDTSAEQ